MDCELVFIERQCQIEIRDKLTQKAIAFVQLFVNGQTGTLYSLTGRGLIFLIQEVDQIFNKFNLIELLAVMESKVLDKIVNNSYLAKNYKVEMRDEIELAGKKMTSIMITEKDM